MIKALLHSKVYGFLGLFCFVVQEQLGVYHVLILLHYCLLDVFQQLLVSVWLAFVSYWSKFTLPAVPMFSV